MARSSTSDKKKIRKMEMKHGEGKEEHNSHKDQRLSPKKEEEAKQRSLIPEGSRLTAFSKEGYQASLSSVTSLLSKTVRKRQPASEPRL
jgi:hypothetical protein